MAAKVNAMCFHFGTLKNFPDSKYALFLFFPVLKCFYGRGHHEVSLGQRTKTAKLHFVRSFIADKKYHLSMIAAIQEVTFYIKLAYKYNGLSMKSDANKMRI